MAAGGINSLVDNDRIARLGQFASGMFSNNSLAPAEVAVHILRHGEIPRCQ